MTTPYTPIPPEYIACPHCLIRMAATSLGRHLGVCVELARKRGES